MMAKKIEEGATREDVEEHHITLAAETLTGDLRDFVLDRLKHDHNPLPWQMRSEKDQHEMVDKVTDVTRRWVERAVRIVAAQGRQVMSGTLAQVVVKDGIRAQIELMRTDPSRHALMDAQGLSVLVVVADATMLDDARAPVKINKDQPGLMDEAAD